MPASYADVFEPNPHAVRLLEILGFSVAQVPRFQDCFIHGYEIVIHTRTGGANRDGYDSELISRNTWPEGDHSGPWNEDLQKSPHYLRDEDDPRDPTYANFFFRFPGAAREELEKLRENGAAQEMPAKRWGGAK